MTKMAFATKLGVALFVALASNATLLSMLLAQKNPKTTTTTATTATSNDNNHDDNAYGSLDGRKRSQQLVHRGGGNRGDDSNQEMEHAPLSVIRNNFGSKRGVGSPETVDERGRLAGLHGGGLGERRKGEEEEEEEGKEGEEEEEVPPRSERSTLSRVDTGHHLDDVIATLTDSELEELGPSIAKILIPALVGLESLVLRELERLHDTSVHQELRLERLEKRQLQEEEVMEAANVIREEQYLLQRKQQQEELSRQQPQNSAPPQREKAETPLQAVSSAETIDFENTTLNSSELVPDDDGSGSGDESLAVVGAVVATTTTNYTESPDSAIINHIYEIYSSLTSMEHKVMELGTSLSVVSSELYRQRSTFVRLEDKVQEIRRTQRTLAMRSTMHGFKLSDLEQFRGQAEMLLRTAEGAIEHFDAKLEVFKDRVTEQQDEMQSMRSVFGRLEQASNELRTADAYKAHDIQELKRGAQQLEMRLTNLYHSLDQYIGNIRWDVKTYLDHLCANNDLQC